jgi:hypothetical protein
MRSSEMHHQRDQALACLVLALCAAAGVFLSVFGSRERIAIEEARTRVALHEGLLSQSAAVLKQNHAALAAVRAALSAEEGARQR